MTSESQASESALIARARAGDQEAYRLLFDGHAGPLRERIRRMVPEPLLRRVSCADIMQEAFLAAAGRIGDFEDRGEGSFGAWLAGIAEHKVQGLVEKHLHAGKRTLFREVTRGARPDTGQFVGKGPTPSALAMAAEMEDAAMRALLELPLDYRRILELIHDQGLAFAAAAVRMDRSEAAARKLYTRALARYEELLRNKQG